ncbi:MAG: PQQ-dependent sugar dehydrogenase [Candidatus Kerfeldbacteria bacterium]|nr:PQQ-dependent sugar dehydrogenase [Candidatus Kerfeldbacteria bacterium]
MRRRYTIIMILVAALVAAWLTAYWYVGADANFLWGLIKSGFTKPTPVAVVSNLNSQSANTNTESVNTNVAQRRFTGFTQETVVTGLTKPTRMAFEEKSQDLFVSELSGNIYRIRDDGSKQLAASGFNQLLGISFVPITSDVIEENRPASELEYTMLVAARGMVSQLLRRGDGTYGEREDIVVGLPAGRHQTDLALIGPDGKLYIATGSRSDRGETAVDPQEAAILVADADGKNLKVFAKGLRNPFGMTFHDGKLYVSDNGQDVPASGVPDELNIVEQGKDYGWVGCWGVSRGPDCDGTEPPVVLLQEHSSANGFAFYDADQFPEAYRGNVFIALWGANSRDPDIGKKVVRIIPHDTGLWKTEDFVTGLGNPIDVKVDPRDGSLLILDFGRGEVIRVSAQYE